MSNIRLKVIRGTRREGMRLCDTCRFGLVTRGAAAEELVFCSWMSAPVKISVTDCNRFDSTVDPTLEQMEEIAFLIKNPRKRLNVGFTGSLTKTN